MGTKSNLTSRNLTWRIGVALCFAIGLNAASRAAADEPVKTLILPGESFLVEGRPAFILTPKATETVGRTPWVFYAPTLNGLPDVHEKWMHEQFLAAGVAVAGIDIGEAYGSPNGQRLFTAFYDEMTRKRGFATKPCLLGRSRGGLWITNWASEHPDKVAGIAGIYPVFDLRTYPGVKNVAAAYELTPEQLEARLTEFNPIERVARLAAAKIPVFLIHGDVDQVVPLEQNSGAFAARYKAAHAEKLITLSVATGQGHNFWEGFFRCQPLIDFAIERARDGARSLVLHPRSFVPLDDSLTGRFARQESIVKWEPRQTALIVCDMWDQHWCRGAAQRVEEMAGQMNELIREARQRGVFIIHAPSTTVNFYAGTPQRKRAQQAKYAPTAAPLETVERWGTAWCYPVDKREPGIPIDDTDMGCDCATKCEIVPPWTRQIKTIEIAEGDAITDNGQETFNLLAERGIDQVIIMGVHLNMCVLGRPFAIRQLVAQGKKVLLIRDMTDTMYNSKMKPFVDHFSGTDLMVSHVEKYWCPTIESTDFLGDRPFRFKEDARDLSAQVK